MRPGLGNNWVSAKSTNQQNQERHHNFFLVATMSKKKALVKVKGADGEKEYKFIDKERFDDIDLGRS